MPLHIDAIAEVLINHGEMFHGGHSRSVAKEWDAYLFTATAVDRWCTVGVWEPWVASYFARNGMMPPHVVAGAKKLKESQPDLDPIYAACNGDLDPQLIVDAYRNS